ncbi:MAG: hypothetical protein U0P48_05250 [Ancrocorticia sp.]
MSPTSSYPTQTSPVTCGIAALAAVAARTRFPDYAHAPLPEVAEAQARLHRVASHTGLPWPRQLGTAPWALAKLVGELTGERYVTRVWASSSNNLRSPRNHSLRRNQAFHAVLRAVEANKDCFLYVGGPQGKRLQRRIPRHVIAVLGAESTETTLRIFEPSSGRVFAVPTDSLLTLSSPSGKARPEFGNWCYPLLAVVPAS